MIRKLLVGLSLFALLPLACSDSEPACPGGVCAPGDLGVPLAPVCDDVACTEGVACSASHLVHDDAELAAAIAAASAGSCIVLAPGSYGDAALPAGVSLLGRWADEITLGALSSPGGERVIRGLSASSLSLSGGGAARVEQARMSGGLVGIDVGATTSLTLTRSEIASTSGSALYAEDSTGVVVEKTYFRDLGGPGVWITCAAGCDCASLTPVSIVGSVIENATHVGVNLVGVDASIVGLAISNVTQGAGMTSGGGLAISGCSEFEAVSVHVDTTDAFGILVQASSGSLGQPGEEEGIIVINGRTGIWLEGIDPGLGQQVTLEGFRVSQSKGVGLGLGLDALGIIVINGRIEDTQSVVVPVEDAVSDTVGDGLIWRTGAGATIDGLVIADSGRNPVLIDGSVAANSTIVALALEGADAGASMLQQGVGPGTTAPSNSSMTPLVQEEMVTFTVPKAPAAP